jgi:hypothetical protein
VEIGTALTTGEYADEQQGVAALDRLLEKADLWHIYPEVRGIVAQPRPEQADKTVRIDRVLVPNRRLIDLGWRHGTIGIEAKRSGVKIGPVIAQAMDYRRSVWQVGEAGTSVWLDWCFIWPMAKQHGPLASVLSQQRIGSVNSSRWHLLYFQAGESTVLEVGWDGVVEVGTANHGKRVGSR